MCEAEARVVRIIFDLRYKRYSTVQIAEYLRRNGIPTRHQGKIGWHATQVYNVLNKEAAYRGEALFHVGITDFKTIAHEPILPTRPLEERNFSARHDIVSLRSHRVPDDVEAVPELRPNRLKIEDAMTEEYARTVAFALQMQDAGQTHEQIAAALTAAGRVRWRGGAEWTRAGVWHLIQPARRAALEAAVAPFLDLSVPVSFEADAALTVDDGVWAGSRDRTTETAAVARIRELRGATGAPYREIAERLTEEGHRTANGAVWCASSVNRVITGERRSARSAPQ